MSAPRGTTLLAALAFGAAIGYILNGAMSPTSDDLLADCLQRKTCSVTRYEYVYADRNGVPATIVPPQITVGDHMIQVPLPPASGSARTCPPFTMPQMNPVPASPKLDDELEMTSQEQIDVLLKYVEELLKSSTTNRELLITEYAKYRDACDAPVSTSESKDSSE